MKTMYSLVAVCFSCVAVVGCGTAPDGADTGDPLNEQEGTTPVPAAKIEQKLCSDGPCGGGGGGGAPGGGGQAADKFRVHLTGIWFSQSCDSGWDGVTGGAGGEFYWTITGNGFTPVTIDYRPADNYASIAPCDWCGMNLNVTKDVWGPTGMPMTMTGSAWEWDAWFEGGDDWLGNWSQPILWSNLPGNGQPAAFSNYAGNNECAWALDYEVSRL